MWHRTVFRLQKFQIYIYIYGEYMMNKWDLNDLNDLKVDYYENFYQYKNRL